VLEIGTVVGFVVLLHLHPTGPAYFIGHALFALVIYTFASDLGIVSSFLSLRVFQWLGSRSFSIYMFHGVVTTWIMLIVHAIEARIRKPLTDDIVAPGNIEVHVVMLPEQWMNDTLTLGYVVVVMLGASLIYRWVENPSRIYFSDLAGRMPKSPGDRSPVVRDTLVPSGNLSPGATSPRRAEKEPVLEDVGTSARRRDVGITRTDA
jgi:peptidoglycan/LPS O-acetylase OafA/YrhL